MTEKEIERSLVGKVAMSELDSGRKKEALLAMAQELRESISVILSANEQDMEYAVGSISLVMLDRLSLDEERVEAMAKGMEVVANLPDPVGRVISTHTREDGLRFDKVASPLGVIAIIYESRPNVTSDAAALALMAGSACILRAGRGAHLTATAIVEALHRGLAKVGLPKEVLTLLSDTSRDSAKNLMTAKGTVDLLIPRGGKGLITACVEQATVPVLETGTGICHGFVDEEADVELATSVVENAKGSRPSVCNSLEVCLVHEKIAEHFLPCLAKKLGTERKKLSRTPISLRLDEKSQEILKDCKDIAFESATEEDFSTEFLDYILAVKVVSSLDEAMEHIGQHSTGHSEVILTKNEAHATKFTQMVDSAAVYVNASTRFTDGGEFGLGCEMGISTQKLHARGPLGLEELCTFKYVITGTGQIRG